MATLDLEGFLQSLKDRNFEDYTKASKKRRYKAYFHWTQGIVLLLLSKKLMVMDVKMVFKFLSAWDGVQWEPIQPSFNLEGHTAGVPVLGCTPRWNTCQWVMGQ